MLPQLETIKGIALDFIFPRYCVGCGREGDFICSTCLRTVNRLLPPICPKCGRPQPSGVLCPDCVNWNSSIDGIRSPFRFEGVIREAIHQLKYGNLRALSPTLAQFLFEYLDDSPIPADVIVPVPLHPKRLRDRGYNQSELIAAELNKLSGAPLIKNSLLRQKNTLPQAKTANVNQRQSNIAGAFICIDAQLRNKEVILIDDVSTSGNTLDACAKAMKAAGAISVWGLTVAREI